MSAMAATGLWSQQQCAWLQALGHTVYFPKGDEESLALPAESAQPAPVEVPANAGEQVRIPARTPATEAAPAPRRSVSVAPAAPVADTRPPAPTFARRSPTRMPDRLQIALLRASGLNPNEPETQRLMAAWPLAELRGDPAAKRALWPQLRALRRR